ncbi:MAG: four helix bundle protein [Clostridia bacterium]|nr:four helix bundle protein [Clostridia bacterium]
MSEANNKVPGHPLKIFDFVSGSGSYITLAKQVYHTACRISYRASDISLKIATIYDIILMKEGALMSENKLLDLSFEFAVAIVNLVDGVTAPKSSYMTDQLARAGTSVGANIHEAQYAQSKKDFVAKLEIALKESNETSYWLKLMYETKRIDISTYQYTEKLCGNIRRLLIASCRTAKESAK